MENSTGVCYDRRCLICRHVTLQNSSIDSQKLMSDATLLQDFLNCFHIYVLDSQVNDLSTLCQFCRTCEQFIVELSSVQTQMTQLTQRAAQLEATLSARLLSAPEIPEPNHHQNVNEIVYNKIKNSQEVELPVLQRKVDDIRNQLQKKYSVRVMLNKIPVPSVLKLEPLPVDYDDKDEAWNLWECEANIPVPFVPKSEPLPGGNDIDDEPWDHSEFEGHDPDEEYLPREDEINEEEASEQILGLSMETEEQANFDGSNSQHSVDSKDTEAKDGNIKTDGYPKRNKRPRAKKAIIVPDGPNRFKYKGMSFQLNEEDQTYTCDACGFKSGPKILSIRTHIINHFMGNWKRDRQSALIPDGPNRFKYNGYDVRLNDEDQCYYCGICNLRGHTSVQSTLLHIRRFHYTAEDKIKFTVVRTSDTEWLYGGKYKITQADEKYKCESCGSTKSILHEMVSHIRAQHVDLEGPDEVVPLPELDIPTFKDLTPIQGEFQSVPYTFDPASRKYTCGLCQSQVSTRNNLHSHMRRNHPASLIKFPCEICGAKLASRQGYKEHMRRHQTGSMPCPTCNKQFKCESSFKMHIKVHELGDAALKYQCEYCGKKFLLPNRYKIHLRIHTGEMPIECPICGIKLRDTSALSHHRLSDHGIQSQFHRLAKVSKCEALLPEENNTKVASNCSSSTGILS